MKINGKEIALKITPKAVRKVEEIDKDFDVLRMIREAQDEGKEPRISDYCKVIYTGYIGATDENIGYEDFLELINDIDIIKINSVGVELLKRRKN